MFNNCSKESSESLQTLSNNQIYSYEVDESMCAAILFRCQAFQMIMNTLKCSEILPGASPKNAILVMQNHPL